MWAIKSIRVLITGRVQGVWFRGWTAEQASQLNLAGWVRNLPDGRVEAVFQGPDEMVDQMCEHCWAGPRMAKVTKIDITSQEPLEGTEFHVVRNV